jgi:hypothetical protein
MKLIYLAQILLWNWAIIMDYTHISGQFQVSPLGLG